MSDALPEPSDLPLSKEDQTVESAGLPPAEANSADAPDTVQMRASDDEQLPEFEELTPELLEDECLRGDVMLRWTVILLALLLGCLFITESRVLVSIRSGQYMLQHGILPPRVDVFSATAAGRAWVNLSWLNDLILGAVHNGLGMNWLTVLCALSTTAAFWCLTRISLAGESSWWSSVCCGLALLAVFPVIQPGSTTVTLLGLGLLLWALALWCDRPMPPLSWGLPVLFLFWTNLDPRCCLGLFVLVLFVIGALITGAVDAGRRKALWQSAGISLLVGILASPWPGRPAMQLTTILRAQQAARTYDGISEFFYRLSFGLKDPQFWRYIDFFAFASLALLLISGITLVLNWRRLQWGWLIAWLGVNLLSIIYGECVCYAALVNAAVASLNGQDWYRRTFRNTYEVTHMNVFWSRAGRALTVLSFFFIAYLAINGALMSPQGRRIGFGLDPRWRNRLQSLEKNVLAHAYGTNIFPTLPSQGDLLIWLGRKPFVDGRLALYQGGGENLLELHRQTRASLFPPRDAPGESPPASEAWKETLQKYDTDDVLLRLWGSSPPYDPVLRLLLNPQWSLTGLGAAGANFTRNDFQNEALRAHNNKYRVTRFAEEAFSPAEAPAVVDLPPTFPAPVSRYDRWLIQRLRISPPAAELAAHYNALLQRLGGQLTAQQACGLAELAIRECRLAAEQEPSDPLIYQILLDSYSILQQIEQQLAMTAGNPRESGAYSSQILACAFAAVKAGGDQPPDLIRLFRILYGQRQVDTARDTLRRFERSLGEHPEVSIAGDQKVELEDIRRQLDDAVDQVRLEIENARAVATPRGQLIGMALQGECPSMALSIIQEDLTELTRSREMQMLYASLLLRCGQTESAWQEIESMESALDRKDVPPAMVPLVAQWRSLAASINLCALDVKRAVSLWESEQRTVLDTETRALLNQPFSAFGLPMQHALWPALTVRIGISAAIEIPERWSQLELQAARADLEAARIKQATQRLESILKFCPEFSQRGVVVFYLQLLTGKSYEPNPPSDLVPTWEGMFAPEGSEKKPATETKSEPAPKATAPATTDQKSPAVPPPVPMPQKLP